MIAWIERLFSGFAFWRGAVIGKWIYYAIIFVALTFLTRFFNPSKPANTQTITAQNAVIQAAPPENKKSFFLGIKLWHIGAGLFAE